MPITEPEWDALVVALGDALDDCHVRPLVRDEVIQALRHRKRWELRDDPVSPPREAYPPITGTLFATVGEMPVIAEVARDFVSRFLADDALMANPSRRAACAQASTAAIVFEVTGLIADQVCHDEMPLWFPESELHGALAITAAEWERVLALFGAAAEAHCPTADGAKQLTELMATNRLFVVATRK
jgi:hypothetical protein